jgi:acyl-CoA hydrolase
MKNKIGLFVWVLLVISALVNVTFFVFGGNVISLMAAIATVIAMGFMAVAQGKI